MKRFGLLRRRITYDAFRRIVGGIDLSSIQDLKVLAGEAWLSMPQAHLFLRVDEIGGSLKMAVVDPEWLRKHLEKNPGALAQVQRRNGGMIIAETRDLQAFVIKHAAGEALFADPFALKRKSGTQPN